MERGGRREVGKKKGRERKWVKEDKTMDGRKKINRASISYTN